MRIAFDVTPLARPVPPGVARAARGLVTALEARGELEVVRVAPPPGVHLGPWRQVELPRAARAAGAVGVQTLVSSFPLAARLPVVNTVHELPWLAGETENAGARHRAWAALARHRAAATVTPSAAAAAALGPRARHVAWGVDAAFLAADGGGEGARAVLRLDDGPYVLAPGGGRAKKRPALLRAALERAAEPWSVVMTGGEAPACAPHPRLLHVGPVAEPLLVALYADAAAVTALARSEGFGFPVLEGFAAGVPAVVPRGAAWTAVCGGLASAVDVEDPDALAAALDALVRAGPAPGAAARRAHAATFTWARAAAALEELWGRLA